MQHDAIIVGAGPGGSTAAAVMARGGLRVLLLDRATFPRDKICGDAISGKSVDVLRKLGLVEEVVAAESLDSWGIVFSGPHGDAVEIPFSRSIDLPVAPGFVCRREVFDNIVFEAAVRAGADVRQGVEVEDLLKDGNRVTGVRLKGGKAAVRDVRSPLVIGADGAYSVVARRLGMDQLNDRHYYAGVRAYYDGVTDFHPRNFIELHFIDEAIPGYFWIFPMRDGRANVGLGTLSSRIKRDGLNLKSILDRIIASPRFRDRFSAAHRVGPVKGWGMPLGSSVRTMAGDGWMLVGDAASLIDPFTGEGIGNAMVSGDLAAKWAIEASSTGRYTADFLQGYEREVVEMLRSELRLSFVMQRLGNWKWLLNTVIRKAARSPEIADTISSMFDDLSQRRKLVSPLFYLRILFR